MCDRGPVKREQEDSSSELSWETLPKSPGHRPDDERSYPRANFYHAFTEDLNPFDRFDQSWNWKEFDSFLKHFRSPEPAYPYRDPYSETLAIGNYLRTPPTCFVIFSKPGLNTIRLAKLISNTWNCVLVSPECLIREEVSKNSDRAKTISRILKDGRCLDRGLVMGLIESRVNQRDVLHRGYVLEGLPLIPDDTSLDYSSYPDEHLDYEPEDVCTAAVVSPGEISPSSTECDLSAVPALAKKTSFTGSQKPKSDSSGEIFNGVNCRKTINHEAAVPGEIEDIFTRWPVKPSIIVYAVCPDEDVVKKRGQFRMDPLTGQTVDQSFRKINKNNRQFSGDKKEKMDIDFKEELYEEILNEEVQNKVQNEEEDQNEVQTEEEVQNEVQDEFQNEVQNEEEYPLLRRIRDLKPNVDYQCSFYKRSALPVIDKWVALHKPENVIRIDSRLPPGRMFRVVNSRLRVLSTQRSIIPRRMIEEIEFAGESPDHIEDRFENRSKSEILLDLTTRNTITPRFTWTLSNWKFLCPVELAKGRTVEGFPKYAVRFLDKIFFLSSSEAANLFVQNPRPFLADAKPRPTCKIAVFGPGQSGKSKLCKELAEVLKARVIDVNEIERSILFDESFDLTAEERARIVLDGLKEVPRRRIDEELSGDGDYIIDGMYPDANVWSAVLESGFEFEEAVYIHEEEPYRCLTRNWKMANGVDQWREIGRATSGVEEFLDESESDDEWLARKFQNYLQGVKRFESSWESLKDFATSVTKNLIYCKLDEIEDLTGHVLNSIRSRYSVKPRIITEDERKIEAELDEYASVIENSEQINQPEATDERESSKDGLGDTNYYCPVALLSHGVLWKGKQEFAASFHERTYLLSSEAALKEFVDEFEKFPIPFLEPLSTIPKFRCSVVGPSGTGKSKISDIISREFNLRHVDYFDGFSTFMKDRGLVGSNRKELLLSVEDPVQELELPENLNDDGFNSDPEVIETFIRRYWRNGGQLPKGMLDECLLKFFRPPLNNQGIVFDGFPSCVEDVAASTGNYAVPEIIIELRAGVEECLKRLVPEVLEAWRMRQEEREREEMARYQKDLSDYKTRRDRWIRRRLKRKREHEETEDDYSIEEETGLTSRVPVPDTRFDYLCEYFKPVSKVPAFLNVVDIAGLVKGAAEGQGLGNSFLSHINACDGIFHLCRAFDDDDVTHIEGDVNPVRDLEIISEELRLKDVEFLNNHLDKLEKLVVRGNDKKLKPEYDTLLKVKGVLLDEKRHIRFADWSANDIEVLNKYLFLTTKPVIYLVNLSEKDYIRKKNKWLIKIKEWVDKNDPGAVLIPFSGYFENKILDMDEAERSKYFEDNKVTSALDKIIVQGYKALQLQYFFTAGHDEVKAWTIQKGTKAPQAAGKIHTDFEKGFIMAEVMKFDDFKNEGSEAAVKAAGKYRQQGRNYVVEDGDIIFFKFNAGAGLKDAKKK